MTPKVSGHDLDPSAQQIGAEVGGQPAGSLALGASIELKNALNTHPVEIDIMDGSGERTVYTNNPQLFKALYDTTYYEGITNNYFDINPSRVDWVEPGTCSAEGELWLKNGKDVVVRDQDDGFRVIEVAGLLEPDLMPDPIHTKTPEVSKISESLGFEVVNDEITAIPSPNTVVHKAAEQGVRIRLFPNKAHVDIKSYLRTYKNKEHPVGARSVYLYTHDISDAHLHALVLGGEKLMDCLSRAARNAEDMDEETQKATVNNIDRFTSSLGYALHGRENRDPVSEIGTLDDLYATGSELGITAEEVDDIIRTAAIESSKRGVPVIGPAKQLIAA